MIHNLRSADQAHSGITDATRTERGIHAAGNGEIAGQWLFRWVGIGGLKNRSLTSGWVDPRPLTIPRKSVRLQAPVSRVDVVRPLSAAAVPVPVGEASTSLTVPPVQVVEPAGAVAIHRVRGPRLVDDQFHIREC